MFETLKDLADHLDWLEVEKRNGRIKESKRKVSPPPPPHPADNILDQIDEFVVHNRAAY